jgi:hypothetical protein
MDQRTSLDDSRKKWTKIRFVAKDRMPPSFARVRQLNDKKIPYHWRAA